MHQLLIVDDQPDLVDDLADMLPWSSVGIGAVHKAYSAQEALDIVVSHPIAVVVTDIRMPGMSGLDLLGQLRESWPGIRCIMLTGYDDFDYAKRALQHQAADYLLKPVEDEELLGSVGKAVQAIEIEWNEISSYQNALQTLKKNLPAMRRHFLAELLEGKRVGAEELEQSLDLLELPFRFGKPFGIVMLRLEDRFDRLIGSDLALMEFAVSNMAGEIFGDEWHLWSAKDRRHYLVFVLQSREETGAAPDRKRLETKASQLQHNVKLFLKGTVSVLVGMSGLFPEDIGRVCDEAAMQFRRRIGHDRELLLSLSEAPMPEQGASSLTQLYDPPLLVHLLEAGRWEALDEKLQAIFAELESRWSHSHEHILETYFMIASSFSYSIHKSKRWMSDMLGGDYERLTGGPGFHSVQHLREWTMRIVGKFKEMAAEEAQDSRSGIVRQVQDYIREHLAEASLQSAASHVYLNPSYLSKVYKSETGEGISDYLIRLKMERAMHKLRSTNDKIYEIAAELGYMKTSYFIKLFREKYGMTPQEFRDKLH